MIDWYWVVAVGLIALIVGVLIGRWLMRRTVETEIGDLSDSLGKAQEGLAASHGRVSGFEKDLTVASTERDEAQNRLDVAASELASLTTSVSALKQNAADGASARKAAEASLATAMAQQTQAAQQAATAKTSAAEAAARYESVTAEFVTVKRERREAVEARTRAEAQRDAKAAEAAAAQSQARIAVEDAERAKEAAVAAAQSERDAALADAQEARKRKVDAAALRNEIMSSQRELADLREELFEKDRRLKLVEAGALTTSEPAPQPAETASPENHGSVEAPVVGSPVVEPAITEADFVVAASEKGSESGQSAIEIVPEAVEVEPSDGPDLVSAAGGDQASPTDEILTVEDLPGGDWEPGQAITINAASEAEPDTSDAVSPAEQGDDVVEVPLADDAEDDVVADPSGSEAPGTPRSADNLRLIKGIGPKFEDLLHARNITTFEQIAAITDDEDLETYLETFGGRIEREQWREQATALRQEQHP